MIRCHPFTLFYSPPPRPIKSTYYIRHLLFHYLFIITCYFVRPSRHQSPMSFINNNNSREGENNNHEFGNSSRTLPIQFFPPSPVGLNNNVTNPQNHMSFTTLLNEGRYHEHDDTYFFNDIQAQADPIENLLRAHNEKLREYYEEYFKNMYGQAMKKVEENASKRLKEKQMEMEHMVEKITHLEDKQAQYSMETRVLKEKLKEKQMQAEQMFRRVVEVEGKQAYYKTEMRLWKEKAERAEEMLWNFTAAPSGGGMAGQEDVASSSFGPPEEDEPVRLACKVCGKRMATIMMWPCKHVCVCKRCNGHGTNQVCPVCDSVNVTTFEVRFP